MTLEEVAKTFCQRNGLVFERKEGEGAFKQTFKVLDKNGSAIALKLYKSNASSIRSAREIAAMQKLAHPNVARLLGVQDVKFAKEDFVVTLEEFLPGGTLTSRGRIPLPDLKKIGAQLVDALSHISAANLVHRDIKPDNIMFRADGTTPVIVDFGVVRNLVDTSLTPSWAPRGPGTPFYSSPEQLNNDKLQIDWRSDQFSLGVVIAETAFGSHPYAFSGCLDGQVVDRVASRKSAGASFLDSCVRTGFIALRTMVAPWPVQRYRTPNALRNAWSAQRID